MNFKVTVSELDKRTGRYVHLFTADNIQSESKAFVVRFKLCSKFGAPQYEVSKVTRWVTTGTVLEDI